MKDTFNKMEEEGFEPSLSLHLNTLSKRAPSATRPSFQIQEPLVYLIFLYFARKIKHIL